MKKILLLILILFSIFLIVGCNEQQLKETVKKTIDTESQDHDEDDDHDKDSVVTEPAVQQASSTDETTSDSTSSVKEFKLIARQWEFEPSTIEVNLGDTVKLSVESIDVTHGLSLSQFGVNEVLNPGKTVEIEFIADKAGTFSFFCSVQCGKGHASMEGTLVVK